MRNESSRYQPLEWGSELDEALKLHLEAYVRLSRQDRALIGALTAKSIRQIGAHRDIVREGDKPRGVILVLEGWGCGYKQLADGRRQIVSFFVPGDLCDANIFILREMDHSVSSITRLKFAEIGHADFETLMTQSPRIAQALWWHELVIGSIQREWTTNVGQRSAYERIAHLLCELFFRLRAVGQIREDTCDFPLTQTDVADATGLTPVHVNRTLQELRKDGLITLQRRELIIHDLDQLVSACMFSPNYLHLDHEGSYLDAND